jgi:hypothetical protein
MLGLMLDNHPDLAVPHEPRFIPDLWRRRARYGRDDRIEHPDIFLRDLGSLSRFHRWKLPVSAVRTELEQFPSPTFGDAIEAVFMAHARRAGKPRWAGKAPQYVDDIPLLARMFPGAVFVHLIRDGRDVALSTLALEHMHRHAATVAHVWARSVGRARMAGSRLGPNRYLEVRYEELVEDPEPSMRRVCALVDLSFEESMLHHVVRDRFEDSIDKQMHGTLALPRTKGLRDWRRDMAPSEVEEFEAIASKELIDSGYELASTPKLRTKLLAWYRFTGFAAGAGRRRVRALRRPSGQPRKSTRLDESSGR